MDLPLAALKENTVKHVWNSASTLSASTVSNVLKSYYLTKCRIMTVSGSVALPQRFLNASLRCPRCCLQYEDGPASFRIQPERKKNRFVRRLLKRNATGENMTRFQEIYLKNLKRKGDMIEQNAVAITCGVCKRDTKEKIQKPHLSVETTEETNLTVKSRKRKKKRDRFSGLNKDVVLSVTPQLNKTGNNMSVESTPQLNKIGNVSVESTPQFSDMKKNFDKRNLFSNKQKYKNNDGKKKKSKTKATKEKLKKLKGLNSILNDSKQKKTPSSSLKQFLTSI